MARTSRGISGVRAGGAVAFAIDDEEKATDLVVAVAGTTMAGDPAFRPPSARRCCRSAG